MHDELCWPQGMCWADGPGVMSDCLAQDRVISVAISHDGQWVVSGSDDYGVRFWDAKTAIPQLTLQGHVECDGPLSIILRSIRPLRTARLTVLPFQSTQLISAPPEICGQPVQPTGWFVSVRLIFSDVPAAQRLTLVCLGKYTTIS